MSLPQNAEQIPILLGVMEALGKRVDVVHHRIEESEIGLPAVLANFAHEIEQAVQDGSERAMLIADD
jgi:hypothetical protein